MFGLTAVKDLRKYFAHPWEPQSRNRSAVLSHVTNPYFDHDITDRVSIEMMRGLAAAFIEVANARGLFGVLADNEALSFWTGAARALWLAGCGSVSEDVAKIGVLEISPRGFQAILELAK